MIKSLPIIGAIIKSPVEMAILGAFSCWGLILLDHSQLFLLLLLLMATDFIMALCVAGKEKKISSRIAQAGLLKKTVMLIVLAMAVILFNTPPISIGAAIVVWLASAGELISLLEKLNKLWPDARYNKIAKLLEKRVDENINLGKTEDSLPCEKGDWEAPDGK